MKIELRQKKKQKKKQGRQEELSDGDRNNSTSFLVKAPCVVN